MREETIFELRALYRDSMRVRGFIFGDGEDSACVAGATRGNEIQQLYVCGGALATYYPVSIPYHGAALNITVQSYAGRVLEFGVTSCRRVLSQDEAHELVGYLKDALKEIERVGRKNKYICVEGYRNEEEKVNLMYWQFTCEMFCTPEEWKWWFKMTGYTGDYSFIYFE